MKRRICAPERMGDTGQRGDAGTHVQAPHGQQHAAGQSDDSKRPQHAVVTGRSDQPENSGPAFLAEKILEVDNKAAILNCCFGQRSFSERSLKQMCDRLDCAYQFFSSNPGHNTVRFNPLKAIWPLCPETAFGAAEYLVRSLFLNGCGGRHGFWDALDRQALFRITTDLAEAGVKYPTLHDYVRQLHSVVRATRRGDGTESLILLNQLAGHPQLEPSDEADEIDMDRILENSEIIDADLNIRTDALATYVGAMLVWSAVKAAAKRIEQGLPRRRLYIVLDEFPTVMKSRGPFEDIEIEGRRLGVALVVTS